MTISREEAVAWLRRYRQAWTEGDPGLASALFSDDCRHFETPYSEPAVGREGVRRYFQAVPDGRSDVRFDFNVLLPAPAVPAFLQSLRTRKPAWERREAVCCSMLREMLYEEAAVLDCSAIREDVGVCC